jgi:hypothetical protein
MYDRKRGRKLEQIKKEKKRDKVNVRDKIKC